MQPRGFSHDVSPASPFVRLAKLLDFAGHTPCMKPSGT